ncbi:MAG TPA: type II toxin-antitoxin system MqsA family antitoxin [Acidobacteriaceae bacterium]|nr:type II toxin-antitoxin system MqsA family antitoxin [Acidobacteriaceae bacterium]
MVNCPACAQESARETRDIPYIYKGESTVISNVTGLFCGACGEAILDADESARVSGLMLEFNRRVNASAVHPEFVR